MILGVDRSHHNDPYPLQKLFDKGIRFIFFKASQGETSHDTTFNASWQEAKGVAGLCRGAYHFFDPRFDGISQAKNYLSAGMDFSKPGVLPPCVDVEDLVGNNDVDTAAQNKWVTNNWQLALKRLNNFLGYIEAQTGKDCIIYTYNNYPKEYFHGHGFPTNLMWLSSLQATCPKRYDTGELPVFWQWTYSFEKSDMDGNYFTGTVEQLNKLANL